MFKEEHLVEGSGELSFIRLELLPGMRAEAWDEVPIFDDPLY